MNKIIKKQEIKPKKINKYILKDEYFFWGGGGKQGKLIKITFYSVNVIF